MSTAISTSTKSTTTCSALGSRSTPILLDLESDQTAEDLERLAENTGGRFFAVERLDQLDAVYEQIEKDLRAQYLLVYAPPSKTTNDFRRVTVDVAPDGLAARTIHGYYP